MNFRLIATTQEIKNLSTPYYKNVGVPIYATKYLARSYAGREIHKNYDEQDRTDLMNYLYSRLYINSKYWVYQYCFQRSKWILMEEISKGEQ